MVKYRQNQDLIKNKPSSKNHKNVQQHNSFCHNMYRIKTMRPTAEPPSTYPPNFDIALFIFEQDDMTVMPLKSLECHIVSAKFKWVPVESCYIDRIISKLKKLHDFYIMP